MNYRIAVCDDDPVFLEETTNLILNYQFEKDMNLTLSPFKSSKNLLTNFRHANDYHIVFLDIEMPEPNGIELASIIRSSIDRHVFIVFVSSYPEYMHDSFKVHPYNYLQKPVSKETLFEVLDEIRLDMDDNNCYLTIDAIDNTSTAVNFNDILYIETIDSKKNLLQFCLTDKKLTAKGTLKEWTKKLEQFPFQKCHNSFLVNIAHIHFFSGSELTMDNLDTLPLSRRMRKELETAYKHQLVIHATGRV